MKISNFRQPVHRPSTESGAVHFLAIIMFFVIIAAVVETINLWNQVSQMHSRLTELSHRLEMLDSRVTTSELKVKNVELKVGL